MIVWDAGHLPQPRRGAVDGRGARGRPRDVLARRREAAAAAGRCSARDGGAKPQWLLIKRRDEEADARRDPQRTQPESVQTGRTIERGRRRRAASELRPRGARRPRSGACVRGPRADDRGRDEGGAHRRALQRPGLDLRAQARRHPLPRDPRRRRACGCSPATTCRSNGRYPGDRRRAGREPCERFAVDGEVVAFDGSQHELRAARRSAAQRRVPVFFYVFDLLWLDGHDVRSLPLRDAQARCCARRSTFDDPLRLTPHRNGDGEALFGEACRKGWEGVIAKRADSPYSDRALARLAQVQVRAGPGAGDRRLHGAARLADGLRRAAARLLTTAASCATRARSGTGFDERDAARRSPRDCARCAATTPPFADAGRRSANAASPGSSPSSSPQVGFTEWTRDGRLRHPRFLGLRDDKPATRGGPRGDDDDDPRGPPRGRDHAIRTRCSSRARRLTKLDLARHYEHVAPVMLAARPRPPAGAAGLPERRSTGRASS